MAKNLRRLRKKWASPPKGKRRIPRKQLSITKPIIKSYHQNDNEFIEEVNPNDQDI